jgi:hypothetical protein
MIDAPCQGKAAQLNAWVISMLRDFTKESVVNVEGVVPQADHRMGQPVFVPEYAYACRGQHEKSSCAGFHPQPAGSEYPQKMTAGKNQHIPIDYAHSAHHLIGPSANLIWQFSAGAAIAEQLPARGFCMNLDRSESFVLAVVPFDQFGIGFGCSPEASQFACAGGALQGTREDLCEGPPSQPFPKAVRIALAPLGQRHIGKPRVPAREAPGSLSVARQIKLWKSFAHVTEPAD